MLYFAACLLPRFQMNLGLRSSETAETHQTKILELALVKTPRVLESSWIQLGFK